jgi:SAM-dependent MidA family methyltransferase
VTPAGQRAPARPWREAWQEALYGEGGFYRRPEGPAGHFRTASHAAPDLLAAAVLRLASAAGCTRVVDVGAGRGELLAALASLPGVAAPGRPHLLGVDVVPRPTGLPASVAWSTQLPDDLHHTLLLAWELLDAVPCDVAEADARGRLRLVEVDASGAERAGRPLGGPELDWCGRWWPAPWPPGTRIEVGTTRDAWWADATGRLASGLAVAVDYDHPRAARPSGGSLTGFRAGRQVLPVPDGTTDVTAHVALDAVAAAVGGRTSLLVRQHRALAALGVTGRRPPAAAATTDPLGYLRALSSAGAAAELLEPGGLGGFGWLLSAAGPDAERLLGSWSHLADPPPAVDPQDR